MLAIRRNWKMIVLAIVLIPPVCFFFVIMPIPFGFMGGPPVRIIDPKLLPDTLESSFETDRTLQPDFDVLQISGLPDRNCIWMVSGHKDYVIQFIEEKRLEITDSKHARSRMLLERMRPNWPKPDLQSWEWFCTEKYGKEQLEGQDLFLVATNSDRSITIVFYEWIF